MPTDIGMIDRVASVAIGLALAAYAIPLGFAPTGWNWFGWVGVIPLATAIFGLYLPYTLLGVPTRLMKRAG